MKPWVPTHEAVEAAYELLRQSPPFSRYTLPPGDAVEFHVMATAEYQGLWFREGDTHVLRISAARVSTLGRLILVLAHEMCHLVVAEIMGGERAIHGSKFMKLARAACRWHRWDEKEFV